MFVGKSQPCPLSAATTNQQTLIVGQFSDHKIWMELAAVINHILGTGLWRQLPSNLVRIVTRTRERSVPGEEVNDYQPWQDYENLFPRLVVFCLLLSDSPTNNRKKKARFVCVLQISSSFSLFVLGLRQRWPCGQPWTAIFFHNLICNLATRRFLANHQSLWPTNYKLMKENGKSLHGWQWPLGCWR